jgi:hypothetical protein
MDNPNNTRKEEAHGPDYCDSRTCWVIRTERMMSVLEGDTRDDDGVTTHADTGSKNEAITTDRTAGTIAGMTAFAPVRTPTTWNRSRSDKQTPTPAHRHTDTTYAHAHTVHGGRAWRQHSNPNRVPTGRDNRADTALKRPVVQTWTFGN